MRPLDVWIKKIRDEKGGLGGKSLILEHIFTLSHKKKKIYIYMVPNGPKQKIRLGFLNTVCCINPLSPFIERWRVFFLVAKVNTLPTS